ncbi:MAG: S8/S53 family peptidase [Bifidobacteriaceae bacterium]|nr:S8/S53 family peptidase [Bifidobacteriaceae bacterium]
MVDATTVDLGSSWLSGYSITQPDVAPTDQHAAQMLSGILRVGTDKPIDPSRIEILVHVVDLASPDPAQSLVDRLTEAAEGDPDLIVVGLGTRSRNSGLCPAVDAAVSQGALVIAAAGNNNNLSPDLPARCENSLAIGALRTATEFDANSVQTDLDYCMVVAGSIVLDNDGNRTSPGGTSVATALAAGSVLALLLEGQEPNTDALRMVLAAPPGGQQQ